MHTLASVGDFMHWWYLEVTACRLCNITCTSIALYFEVMRTIVKVTFIVVSLLWSPRFIDSVMTFTTFIST